MFLLFNFTTTLEAENRKHIGLYDLYLLLPLILIFNGGIFFVLRELSCLRLSSMTN